MVLSVVGNHVKLARLAALDVTHVGFGNTVGLTTRLFYAMAHLLSAGNGAAWNRLGTSIFVSDEYNPHILYTGQTCHCLLDWTRLF